jgi:predicted metal-dependent peptidase
MKHDVLAKAKTSLILDQPFFATMALGFEYIEKPSISTCGVDGEKLYYNKDFIDKLNVDMCKSVLAHEVMHVACLHHLRRGNRDFNLWNKACDYAINGVLKDAGFKMPDNVLYSSAFKDMNAEKIYDILQQQQSKNKKDKKGQQQQQQQTGSGQNDSDGNNDDDDNGNNNGNNNQNKEENRDESNDNIPDNSPAAWGKVLDADCKSESERKQQEAETLQKVITAVSVGKKAGFVPGNIERQIDEALNPKVDWREQLRFIVSTLTRNDYSWRMPSQRYLCQGIYLPKLESPQTGGIVLAVDTSCSIDEIQLNEFAGEIRAIAELTNDPVTVIYCDSKIAGIEELTDEPLHPKGGGGTDVRPVFKHVNNNMQECKVLIYFTDGEFYEQPPAEPDYQVIWAITDNSNFTSEFGTIIHLN